MVQHLIVDGKIIESIYHLIFDFLCITNKTLIFVDKDLALTNSSHCNDLSEFPCSMRILSNRIYNCTK